jgi:hypothetical protein
VKTVFTCLLGFSVVLSLSIGLRSEGRFLPNGGPKEQTYHHDAGGIEKQFQPFLKAVGKGDPEKIKESFAVFALPDPQGWFAQYFAKDQVQQLVWDNESEVDGYRNSLTMMLSRFLRGPNYSVSCKLKTDASTKLAPRDDAVIPVSQVPTEQYSIKLTGSDGHNMEQLSNFVYVDGAFRYVGKGAYPFWSMPDATRKSN